MNCKSILKAGVLSLLIASPLSYAIPEQCQTVIFSGTTLYRNLDTTMCITKEGQIAFEQREKDGNYPLIEVQETTDNAIYQFDDQSEGGSQLKEFTLRHDEIHYVVSSGYNAEKTPYANVSIITNGMLLSFLEIDTQTVKNIVDRDFGTRFHINTIEEYD